MMGGGFFDNMWDPYSAAYAYPRPSQPRGRYYRPRAPVYEQRPAYEQQHPAYAERRGASRVEPEDHIRSKVKVEEPASRKTVRTIPVTDGNLPADVKSAQKVEVARPGPRFGTEDAAATKIQAVYRGYSVRKTEPLKHLRVIMKVQEEFEGFKCRLQEKEQRVKLCSDSQERLRWTEGIMALLLRLDQLQGVHPEVRLIRKAAAKELLVFQEKLDSMSNISEEANVDNDSVAEEESKVCDVAAEEESEVTDDDMDVPAAEAGEEMKAGEESMSHVEDVDLEEPTRAELAVGATEEHQQAMEQDSTSPEESNERNNGSDGIQISEMPTSEQHTLHDKCEQDMNHDNQGISLSDTIGESMVKGAEQDGVELGFLKAAAEVPMDVENEASTMAPAVPPMDVEGDRESSGVVDDPAVTAPPTDVIAESMSKEAEVGVSTEIDLMEFHNQSHDMGRGDEAERLTDEERPELGTLGNAGDDFLTCTSLEEKATDAGSVDTADGWMVPASPTSLEPQCSVKSLQVGQPQILTAGDTISLSERALLEQLLEENRKLKDALGRMLHWGKEHNEFIHNLASRVQQLEEHKSQSNMLHGLNGRKRICNDGGLAGDKERSRRSKGRRKGRHGNKTQLGYLDSEWPSPESDEYF